MIFLAFLVSDVGTLAYFYNYGMKRLPWREAKKKFVGSENEKILGPLQLYRG